MTDELKIGDKLIDNDPRCVIRRVLTITNILPNGVLAVDRNGRAFRLLRHRLFTDGKQRRYGLSRIDHDHT
jgi:hypothetical protein